MEAETMTAEAMMMITIIMDKDGEVDAPSGIGGGRVTAVRNGGGGGGGVSIRPNARGIYREREKWFIYIRRGARDYWYVVIYYYIYY